MEGDLGSYRNHVMIDGEEKEISISSVQLPGSVSYK